MDISSYRFNPIGLWILEDFFIMKFKWSEVTWVDYLLFVWFILFIVTWTLEGYYGQLNLWILGIYLIVGGILIIIKTFIKKK